MGLTRYYKTKKFFLHLSKIKSLQYIAIRYTSASWACRVDGAVCTSRRERTTVQAIIII